VSLSLYEMMLSMLDINRNYNIDMKRSKEANEIEELKRD
jgi:hypothetical protein